MLPGGAFDDSADCGGGGATGGYGVTAVRDDLDNNDGDIMAEGLSRLGLESAVSDFNVTSSTLRHYLAQELETLYHTGHGLEGAIMTSDGQVSCYDVTINVRNTVFATCLALAES